MRPLRLVVVAVLVGALAANAAAGNAAVAAERTVLSGEYVKAALAEEGAYDALRTMMTEQVAAGVGGGGSDGNGSAGAAGGGGPAAMPISQSELVEGAVTREYVRDQGARNVDRLYSYLHGDRDSVALALNLTPVRANVAAGMESQLRDASLAELLRPAAGESGDLELQGVAVDPATFDDLAADESSYRETRSEFRAQVRATVLDRAVEEAIQSASNDELLALVIDDYDPDDYSEAEKERMVADREAEIEAAVRGQIESERGDEIDRRVDEELAALPDSVRERAEEAGSPDGVPAEVADSYADLTVVGVRGLSGDLSYDEYTDRLESAKADFAGDAAATAESQLADEMPAQATIADSTDPQTGQALSEARRAVGIVDVLSIALPLLGLVLIGLIWWLTRSVAATAAGTGIGLVVGGLPGVAAASLVPSMLADALGDGPPPEIREVVLRLVDRTAGAIAGQSAALVVAGILLVAASIYLRTYGTPAWAREIRG